PGNRKRVETSTNIRTVTYQPDNLPEQDCCNTCKDAGLWLGNNCGEGSGMWHLHPGLLVPSDNWVATMLHAIEWRLLNTIWRNALCL
ncbi:MAG: hypothetical protein ACKPKO_26290, partial [Candidatus Fonsibacter sp.]